MFHNFEQIKLVIFDFDGVFTDNAVYVDEFGHEQVKCSRSDGIGLQKLRTLNVEMLVLSTEKNPVVSARCQKLKLECIQGCSDKAIEFRDLVKRRGINPMDVAYVGNDINDLEIMTLVGHPIAVCDAYPEVLSIAKHITEKKGGCGAVREVCEIIYSVKVKYAGTFQS